MNYCNKNCVTLCFWTGSVGRNHWSEPCCIVSVCLSEEPESSVWAGWTQCGCSSDTEPVKKTLEIIYLSTAQVHFKPSRFLIFSVICTLMLGR